MGKIKYPLDEIKRIVNENGFELINREKNKLTLIDIEGYKYYIDIYIFISFHNPKKFHESNPYTIQNIKLWCEINNKLFNILDNQKYENNHKYLKWQCLKESCGEIFEMNWSNIHSGKGCGFCVGRQVGISNCLATLNPKLASEWHPTKNGDLTPFDVTCGSSKDAWWKCENGHEWQDKIRTRNNKPCCSYCSHQLPSKEYNLLILYPIICEEWNYKKNIDSPEDYLPYSGKKVWWKCKDCGHEWPTRINARTGIIKSGCPECKKSKGEKECKRIFISKGFILINQEDYEKLSKTENNSHIYYIPQMKFDNLIGLGGGLLPYDFYIPKYNFIIEYDGEFHYKPIKNYKNEPVKHAEERLKKVQIHDKLKDDYCKEHNIKILRIPYKDFDNIEAILTKELNILAKAS